MKYFTSRIWSGLNAIDPQARKSAFERSDQAWDQYYAYLDSIRPKTFCQKMADDPAMPWIARLCDRISLCQL